MQLNLSLTNKHSHRTSPDIERVVDLTITDNGIWIKVTGSKKIEFLTVADLDYIRQYGMTVTAYEDSKYGRQS
jgi:hypothetical protein